jgi:hypothetical protein
MSPNHSNAWGRARQTHAILCAACAAARARRQTLSRSVVCPRCAFPGPHHASAAGDPFHRPGDTPCYCVVSLCVLHAGKHDATATADTSVVCVRAVCAAAQHLPLNRACGGKVLKERPRPVSSPKTGRGALLRWVPRFSTLSD